MPLQMTRCEMIAPLKILFSPSEESLRNGSVYFRVR